MAESDPGFVAAVEEAQQGFAEGGVPIGACLVSRDGKILGRGHNMRVQKGSATLHVSHSCPSRSRHCAETIIGRDISSREFWPLASFSLRRRYHVHDLVAM